MSSEKHFRLVLNEWEKSAIPENCLHNDGPGDAVVQSLAPTTKKAQPACSRLQDGKERLEHIRALLGDRSTLETANNKPAAPSIGEARKPCLAVAPQPARISYTAPSLVVKNIQATPLTKTNHTRLENFGEACRKIRRHPDALLRYFAYRLDSLPFRRGDDGYYLLGLHTWATINGIFEEIKELYVYCRVCGGCCTALDGDEMICKECEAITFLPSDWLTQYMYLH